MAELGSHVYDKETNLLNNIIEIMICNVSNLEFSFHSSLKNTLSLPQKRCDPG